MIGFKITNFWAFVAEDDGRGDEGLIATMVGDKWMPFVCSDETRVDMLRPFAKQIAEASNKKVKLMKFSSFEVLEEYECSEV